MILLTQMAILFLIMAVGFLCKRTNLLDDLSVKKLSGLVVNVANPCMVLSAAVGDHAGSDNMLLLSTVVLSLVMYAVFLVLAAMVPKLLRVPAGDVPAYKLMMIFSNIGFMGFPVISAAYGQEALLYASVFLFPYNFLIYTYGISVMTGESMVKGGIRWKKIFNIGVLSGILAIALYIADLHLPSVLSQSIGTLGGLTAPLSMIVIGYSIAEMDLKTLFTDVRLLLFSVIKLLLLPIAGVTLCRLCRVPEALLGVSFIMLAMPVGSMTAMLASQYGRNEELASRAVAITTILSVVTLPLMSALLGV